MHYYLDHLLILLYFCYYLILSCNLLIPVMVLLVPLIMLTQAELIKMRQLRLPWSLMIIIPAISIKGLIKERI